jgi:calcineurin-like phosphoesterase family protein
LTTWFISDTHFGHRNILKYSNRPFSSIKEMNEVMIQNWNRCVKAEDEIWHLGDFAFGSISFTKQILQSLNGKINLVYGNHDQEIIKHLDQICMEIKTAQYYKEISWYKQKIVLFHYGQRVWRDSHHGAIMLHGHSHGSLPPYGKSVDIGVDAPFILNRWPDSEPMTPLPLDLIRRQEDYRPIHIDEVIEYMKNRNIEYVDHHQGEM